jgi:hypothetical protein
MPMDKFYDAIARRLKMERPRADWNPSGANQAAQTNQWERDVWAVAMSLHEHNPNFKFSTFYEACGYESAARKAATHESVTAILR